MLISGVDCLVVVGCVVSYQRVLKNDSLYDSPGAAALVLLCTIDQKILPRIGSAMFKKSATPREKLSLGGLLPGVSEALKCIKSSHGLLGVPPRFLGVLH